MNDCEKFLSGIYTIVSTCTSLNKVYLSKLLSTGLYFARINSAFQGMRHEVRRCCFSAYLTVKVICQEHCTIPTKNIVTDDRKTLISTQCLSFIDLVYHCHNSLHMPKFNQEKWNKYVPCESLSLFTKQRKAF